VTQILITEAVVLKRSPEVDPDLWIGEIELGSGAIERCSVTGSPGIKSVNF